MKEQMILGTQNTIEDYEIAIMQSQIDNINLILQAYEAIDRDEAEFDQRWHAVLSKKVGYLVTKDNIDNIKITNKDFGDVCDEVFNRQNCLIRPSHYLMPYSLVRKKPELKKYIPAQEPQSFLDLLSDRSTSRAFEIIKEYTSENTRLAHIGDQVYWQAFLEAINFNFYKNITEKEVLTFIVQHAEGLDPDIDQKLVNQRHKSKLGPHKLATIKRRVASLSVFLEESKWPNPCHSQDVKNLLQKLTKKYGSSRPAGKAITKDILDDMLDTCKDSLIDLRDKALLLFAWGSGGRRRKEVTAADMKDLTRTPEGEFVYHIPHGKTDQEGKGYVVPIKGRAALVLSEWLATTGITEGAIFRAVNKGGKTEGALSAIDIHRIVRKRLKAAGYDETHFGAHSLRSGFVTEAGRKGKPLGDVMALTTHRNVGTVMKYYQAGSVINNSASNLAD
jgi:integrase